MTTTKKKREGEEVTQLDEKALKAAKAVEGLPTEYVIRAYLDALPPADRRYVEKFDEGAFGSSFFRAKDGRYTATDFGRDFVEVEIREVRPSPPSVEG